MRIDAEARKRLEAWDRAHDEFLADTKARAEAFAYELDNILAEAEDLAAEPVPAPPPTDAGRLAIVVGHTKRRQGAVALPPIGTSEYQWNTDLAERIRAFADERDDVAVEIFWRDNGGLKGAYGRARAWGAQAAIELHFNASNNSKARGTETIYGDWERDQVFARIVQAEMVEALGLRDRGVKEPWNGRGAVNLSHLKVPSIIVEPGFGSNPHGAATMHAERDDLARALLDAAARFFAA